MQNSTSICILRRADGEEEFVDGEREYRRGERGRDGGGRGRRRNRRGRNGRCAIGSIIVAAGMRAILKERQRCVRERGNVKR